MRSSKSAEKGGVCEDFREYEWVYDSIVQYLNSPMWKNPIHSFIDEHCLVFTPNDPENKLSYTEIHIQFRKLFSQNLEEFLKDLGLSPETFVECCLQGNNKQLRNLVLEHILAMDDYLTFKKMMEKRNIELEYEALQEIKKHKTSKNSGPTEGSDAATVSTEDEELKNIFSESIIEEEMRRKQKEMEEAELQQAIVMSVALSGISNNENTEKHSGSSTSVKPAVEIPQNNAPNDNKCLDEEEMELISSKNIPHEQKFEGINNVRKKSQIILAPLQQKKISGSSLGPLKLKNSTIQENKNTEVCSKLSKEEMDIRLAYLQKQKQKLVHKKQQERNGDLSKDETQKIDENPLDHIKKMQQKDDQNTNMRASLTKKLMQDLLEQKEQEKQQQSISRIIEMSEKLKQVEEIRQFRMLEDQKMKKEQQEERVRDLSKLFSNLQAQDTDDFLYQEK